MSALALSLALSPSVAYGQDAGAPEVFADVDMETILVTARRTEEDLQDVPQSIAVLTAEEIERSNFGNVRDYLVRLPNISFTEGSSPVDTNISIRGISNFIATGASGPTTAIYVDEVIVNPTGGTIGIDPNLFDLERIEAVFGPQGTTFGRGAIGGVINLVTQKPTEEFSASLSVEGGSFPDGEVRGVINGSLTGDDKLTARLVAFGAISDGFVEFAAPELGSVGSESYGARLSLRSQATEKLVLDLSGSFDRTNFDGTNTASVDSILGGEQLLSLADFQGPNQADRSLITARGTYDTGFGDFIATTSYFLASNDVASDSDFTPLDFFVTTGETVEDSVAQEFRFQSIDFDAPILGRTSFVVGANFSFNDFDSTFVLAPGDDAFFILTAGLPGGPFPNDGSTVTTVFDQEVFNVGVFGDVRFRPIPKLELSAGARFNRDNVEVSGENISFGVAAFVAPPIPAFFGEEDFSAVTPKGSILYEWTDTVSTYFSVSTGFRAGGFNSAAGAVGVPFDEENAISYEGGVKSTWFGGRLVFNANGFFVDYDDLQVVAVDVIGGVATSFTTNAASARSIGTEITLDANPFDGFTLNAGYGFTQAIFTDFADSPFGDLTGATLPNAPAHTFSLVGDYERSLSYLQGQGFIRAE
ncbi:MAG: TonB-dependent receptor [Maricaulaceae bacterium]